MQTEVVISGFGGQGALFAGQLLAHAALHQGMEVSWLPSYGPEMRGGTAHCIVILSGEPIASPIVRNPRAAVVMNNPSMIRYQPLVRPGGVLVVNASLVTEPADRADVRVLHVPASQIADELGEPRLLNVVLLGALLAALPIVRRDSISSALQANLPERHRHLWEKNLQAFDRGASFPARITEVAR